MDKNLEKFSGDPVAMALDAKLVDGALSRDELNKKLIDLFGLDDGKQKSFKNVKVDKY